MRCSSTSHSRRSSWRPRERVSPDARGRMPLGEASCSRRPWSSPSRSRAGWRRTPAPGGSCISPRSSDRGLHRRRSARPGLARGLGPRAASRPGEEAAGSHRTRGARARQCCSLLPGHGVQVRYAQHGTLLLPAFAIVIAVFATQGGWFSSILSSRALVHLGEISYSVYMLHHLVIRYIATYFSRKVYLGTMSARQIVAHIFVVVVILALSDALYRYFEDPVRRMYSPEKVPCHSEFVWRSQRTLTLTTDSRKIAPSVVQHENGRACSRVVGLRSGKISRRLGPLCAERDAAHGHRHREISADA